MTSTPIDPRQFEFAEAWRDAHAADLAAWYRRTVPDGPADLPVEDLARLHATAQLWCETGFCVQDDGWQGIVGYRCDDAEEVAVDTTGLDPDALEWSRNALSLRARHTGRKCPRSCPEGQCQNLHKKH